jgi:hypothetical protein
VLGLCLTLLTLTANTSAKSRSWKTIILQCPSFLVSSTKGFKKRLI